MPADERRAQLIEAALDVFSRQGFRGATTKEIAAQAGVAEAVIFRHFPSKEALYDAVLDSRLGSPERRRLMAVLEALMERDDDEGVFRTIIRNTVERYSRDPRFERVVLFAALEGHELGLARIGRTGDPHLQAIRAYIARRQKAGAIGPGDPLTILIAVNGMAHFYGTITSIFQAPRTDGPDESAADLLARIALHGLARRASPPRARKPRT